MAFDNMDYDFDDQEPIMGYEEEEQPPPSRGGFDLGGMLEPITSNPLYLGVSALAAGLLLGLLIFWVLWPVKPVNTTPASLHKTFQEDYMQMMIDSYYLDQNGEKARWRFDALGEAGPVVLQEFLETTPPDSVEYQRVLFFAQNYTSGSATQGGTAIPTDQGTTGQQTGTDTGAQDAGGGISSWLLMACGVTGIVVLGAGAFYFFRMRNRQPAGKTAAMRAQEFSRQAEQTDYESLGEHPPIAQWMTTYLVGDDLFDDSFSIDSMNGEFLGECGVGIADTIGVGEPKRVSAFEVWLFDKNDIQTVTNVVLSEHAFRDEMTLNRLKAKGEPYLALLGGEIEMVTKTLRMVVKIMDMDYGTGHLPENSFFQRITLELAVWEL